MAKSLKLGIFLEIKVRLNDIEWSDGLDKNFQSLSHWLREEKFQVSGKVCSDLHQNTAIGSSRMHILLMPKASGYEPIYDSSPIGTKYPVWTLHTDKQCFEVLEHRTWGWNDSFWNKDLTKWNMDPPLDSRGGVVHWHPSPFCSILTRKTKEWPLELRKIP